MDAHELKIRTRKTWDPNSSIKSDKQHDQSRSYTSTRSSVSRPQGTKLQFSICYSPWCSWSLPSFQIWISAFETFVRVEFSDCQLTNTVCEMRLPQLFLQFLLLFSILAQVALSVSWSPDDIEVTSFYSSSTVLMQRYSMWDKSCKNSRAQISISTNMSAWKRASPPRRRKLPAPTGGNH